MIRNNLHGRNKNEWESEDLIQYLALQLTCLTEQLVLIFLNLVEQRGQKLSFVNVVCFINSMFMNFLTTKSVRFCSLFH